MSAMWPSALGPMAYSASLQLFSLQVAASLLLTGSPSSGPQSGGRRTFTRNDLRDLYNCRPCSDVVCPTLAPGCQPIHDYYNPCSCCLQCAATEGQNCKPQRRGCARGLRCRPRYTGPGWIKIYMTRGGVCKRINPVMTKYI